MKRKFENVNDVPRYAIVKYDECDEVKIVELSDSVRQKCYEEFKDEEIVYHKVVEFLGFDSIFYTVLFAQRIKNVKKC